MRGKGEWRHEIWCLMEKRQVGRFPFPLKNRIPNFKGAEKAAERLRDWEGYKGVDCVKVNPDSPQLPIRAQVLKDGKTLLVPTPRLKAGFIQIKPEEVPPGDERKAASLSHMKSYGKEMPLSEIPVIDLIVVGSVVIHPDGRRLGKGAGYADREYAILRELGNPEVPIVTSIHSLQLVDAAFPRDEYDLTVDYIFTEKEMHPTHSPYPKPDRIVWDYVSEEEKRAMPVLKELWDRKYKS